MLFLVIGAITACYQNALSAVRSKTGWPVIETDYQGTALYLPRCMQGWFIFITQFSMSNPIYIKNRQKVIFLNGICMSFMIFVILQWSLRFVLILVIL